MGLTSFWGHIGLLFLSFIITLHVEGERKTHMCFSQIHCWIRGEPQISISFAQQKLTEVLLSAPQKERAQQVGLWERQNLKTCFFLGCEQSALLGVSSTGAGPATSAQPHSSKNSASDVQPKL